MTKLKTCKSDSRQFVFVAKKIINHCLPRPKLRLYGGMEILIGLIINPHVSYVASACVVIDQPQNIHIYERISTNISDNYSHCNEVWCGILCKTSCDHSSLQMSHCLVSVACFSQPRNTVTCDRWVKKIDYFSQSLYTTMLALRNSVSLLRTVGLPLFYTRLHMFRSTVVRWILTNLYMTDC